MPQHATTSVPSSRKPPHQTLIDEQTTLSQRMMSEEGSHVTHTDNIRRVAFAKGTSADEADLAFRVTDTGHDFSNRKLKVKSPPVSFNVAGGRRPGGSDAVSKASNSVYNFSSRAMLTARRQNNKTSLPYDYSVLETISTYVNPEIMEFYSAHKFINRTCPATTNFGCDGGQTEHSNRYRDRQTASPKVVDVIPRNLPNSKKEPRGVYGFFPPVKLRSPADSNSGTSGHCERSVSKRKRVNMKTPPFVLELAPEETGAVASYPDPGPVRVPSARSDPVWTTSVNKSLSMSPPVYPHLASEPACDDLTTMPRPRMMVSKGELPWVYRYKVKKNMNELSKIMASRPAKSLDSYSFTYRYDP